MLVHRFRLGDKVTVAPNASNGPIRPGVYTITRLLPVEGTLRQYRGRSDFDTYERVLDETQLTPVRT